MSLNRDCTVFSNFCVTEPLYDEVDSICVGSVVFAGVIGSMAFVALMSSVIVSLLCLKMKRLKDTEASVDNQLNTKDVRIYTYFFEYVITSKTTGF